MRAPSLVSERLRRRIQVGTRPRRWVGVAAPLLALVMATALFAPSAQAKFEIEITPPYLGLTPIAATGSATDGCHSSATFVGPTTVHLTNGHVRADERSIARTCGTLPNYADITAFLGFQGPNFTVPVSGTYRVSFDWSIVASYSVRSEGNATNWARAFIFELGVLLVPSNNSDLNVNSPALLFVNEHPGPPQRATVTIPADLSGNVTLIAGDTYQFLTLLTIGTQVFLMGAGSGAATIDVASPVNHAALRAITLVG